MRSIPQAIAWELFHRSWWTLVLGFLGSLALPAMILAALRRDGAINSTDEGMLVMHLVLIQICMFTLGASIFQVQGMPSRLYTYPVSATTIAVAHLVPAMLLVGAEFPACTALLNAVFRLDWPIWGPALFVAASVAAIQASLWFTEKSGWMVLALGLVAGALGIWLKSRYGPILGKVNHLWDTMTPLEVVTLTGVVIASFPLAIAGVNRGRRGEPPFSIGLLAWLERVLDGGPDVGRPFRSPQEAQAWFEWRKKGWAMPAAVLFGLAVGLTGWLIFSRNPRSLVEGMLAGGGLLSALAIVGGVILGNNGPDDSHWDVGHFLASGRSPTPTSPASFSGRPSAACC